MATSNTSLPRICVLGSLNIDLVSYVPHHPEPGETLTSSSFDVSPGGKGANQAVACAKLSRPRPRPGSGSGSGSGNGSGNGSSDDNAQTTAHVSMVGAVGADTYGQILLDNLTAHGVDVRGVARPGSLKTGIALIIVDEPTGQNRIVLSPEANHQGNAPEDFDTAIWPRVVAAATTTSSSSSGGEKGQGKEEEGERPDLLIMQLEVPLPTVLGALSAARSAGIPVLLNPAPAAELPGDAYRGLAHLVVNETEAAALSGLPVGRLDTAEGCAEVAGVFVGRGVRNVIITLGGRGVYYKSSAGDNGGLEGLVPAERVKEVVDTTAAGDTFVGQYALEVVGSGARGEEGFDVAAAVRKSNKAAALTVQRKGAAASIPWRDEVV
ncbi:putative ribokinase [Cytospora paraplurivora]|uniref:Ribokinase n=1 Tax=Cytospora paraplurivora TaxID=2898453 RepID=A0AAN9UJL4_9PEZI